MVAFWMPAITKNHKNSCLGSTIKLTITKFESIFNLNMLLAILDENRYQKSQKWLPWLCN